MLRATGGVLLAAGTAVALTSCAMLGTPGGAGPTASSSASTVQDPSLPSASPSSSAAAALTSTPTAPPDEVQTISPAPSVSTTTAPADARTAVTPFITSATATGGRIDVSAIVPKVVESGGTCTLTVTSGASTETATASASAASSYTGCQPLSVKGLAAGTWQVQVRYASAESVGASASRTVTVG